MSRLFGRIWVLPLVLFAGTQTGCIVEESPPPPPPDTEIGFDPAMTFGQTCGQLTNWTVTDRDDGWVKPAACNEQIVFTGLAPNASYTFDILGYSGGRLCWQGACSVPTARGLLTYGDCSNSVQYLCAH